MYDEEEPPVLSNFDQLANRTAGGPIDIPDKLPGYASRSPSHRFADTAVYPALETNVDAAAMSYSQEDIPEIRTKNSINLHGPDTPFRHHTVIRQWVEDLLNRNGYQDLVEYNTTVEKAVKDPKSDKWILTLRRGEKAGKEDYWWIEEFDALVVASGHYSVPYIPHIKGLKEFAEAYPGSIEHTKGYRHPEKYRGKVCLEFFFRGYIPSNAAPESYHCRRIRLRRRYGRQYSRRCTASSLCCCSRKIQRLFRR